MTRLAFMIATVLATALIGPAWAAEELGLSRDGRTWSANLTEPLYDPAFRWVPGDSESRDFLARNQTADPALLEVEMQGVSVDSLLETGDLHVSARGGDGPWMTVSDPGTRTLVKSMPLGAGRSERISVRVSFDETSPNLSQRTMLDLRFEVRLTQAKALPDSAGLPSTGGPPLALLLVGGALVALGAIALALGRRRHGGSDG